LFHIAKLHPNHPVTPLCHCLVFVSVHYFALNKAMGDVDGNHLVKYYFRTNIDMEEAVVSGQWARQASLLQDQG